MPTASDDVKQLYSAMVNGIAKNNMDQDLVYMIPAEFMGQRLRADQPELLFTACGNMIDANVHKNAVANFLFSLVVSHACTGSFVEFVKANYIPDFELPQSAAAPEASSQEGEGSTKEESPTKKRTRKAAPTSNTAGGLAPPPPATPSSLVEINIPIYAEDANTIRDLMATKSPLDGTPVGETLFNHAVPINGTNLQAHIELVNSESGCVLNAWITDDRDNLKGSSEPNYNFESPTVVSFNLVDYHVKLLVTPY